jgi:hypothetical protein
LDGGLEVALALGDEHFEEDWVVVHRDLLVVRKFPARRSTSV